MFWFEKHPEYTKTTWYIWAKKILKNSTDPDQTAPKRAVWSGSVLFAIENIQ